MILNGEHGTAINLRRKLIIQNLKEDIGSENHFVNLVCLRNKKSSAIWDYKLFLI